MHDLKAFTKLTVELELRFLRRTLQRCRFLAMAGFAFNKNACGADILMRIK
jgi:hypothetical protein